ncbi:MAG: DUF2442 domain-containing protein [Anaerolineae bacterium]
MPTPFGTYVNVRYLVVLPGYLLQLQFDDGSERVIDFEPLLLGPLWGALRDEALFAQVRVNSDTGTIEWPNGADLNPVILHDWPEYSEQIIAERRARYAAIV